MSLPTAAPVNAEQYVGDELLLFDRNARVHRLAPVAAAVFQACRRGASLEEVEATLPDGLLDPALAELHAAGLVSAPPRLTRREALKVALLPLVVSLAVPPPAAATSGCVTNCVVNCNDTNLCSNATPSLTADADCGTVFCGIQYVYSSSDSLCNDSVFIAAGCFLINGGTRQRSCFDARIAAAGVGEGTHYSCCDCPPP